MSNHPLDFEDYESSGPRRSPKSRLAYILLALFLGGLGIHNFYAGRTLRGLLQLGLLVVSFPLMLVLVGFVTVWIPSLWALWDLIFVHRDGRGRLME